MSDGAADRADVAPDIALADRVFQELRARTADTQGVTRMSYGAGENIAHGILRREAEALGLTVETDAALNLYVTLPGLSQRPGLVIGSHLDSVPMGGNYDGAAGVLMGLSVVSGLIAAGRRPPVSITVMAIRAEESAWFAASYIGSRAAFGRLSADELRTVRRAGDDAPLGEAIDQAGGRAAAIARGDAHLRPQDIAIFLEPHIEQGPVLFQDGLPLGIVTDIRGSLRYRRAACRGTYAHSGATPRAARQDAVLCVAKLGVALDQMWRDFETEGHDITVTIGELATDPVEASFSKVAGFVGFSLDMRSNSQATLEAFATELAGLIAEIETDHGVTFDLGPATTSTPARMDRAIIDGLAAAAQGQGVAAPRMPCGAGHDAAVFAGLGVPTGMLFLRNEHGSHNPQEHMEMADFAAGADVLMRFCLAPPDVPA